MVLDKETRINKLAREICTLQNKCEDCSKHECMTKDIVAHIYRELIPEVFKDIKSLLNNVDHVVDSDYDYWEVAAGYNISQVDKGLEKLAKQYGVEVK